MKPVSADVARLTDDGLALRIGGRIYGAAKDRTLDGLKAMDVPKDLDPLVDSLVRKSELLKLEKAGSHTDIYSRYGNDLQMLTRYRNALRACVAAAIEARAESRHTDSQAFLKTLIDDIDPVEFKPSLRLADEELKLGLDELLLKLQKQFRDDVTNLTRNVALWFHALANKEVVSVIEWFNPTALRYHFFRMEDDRTALGTTKETTGDFFKGRTTTTTKKTQVDTYAERRAHTVVDAQAHTIDAYRAKVPQRIARLIDSIPPEMKEFVTIIDGHVSQEEVHRRKATSRVEVETKSVFTPDPAVALFNTWAIGGWGGSTPEASRSVYQGHAIERANRELALWVLAAVAVAVPGVMLAGMRGAAVLTGAVALIALIRQAGLRLENRNK